MCSFSQPKAQPKSAAGKQGNNNAKGGAKGNTGKGRRGRNARPTSKSATELDADMDNYMADTTPNVNAAASASAAAPAANGDSAMDDEISVSC